MQFTDEHVEDLLNDINNATKVIKDLKEKFSPFMGTEPQITIENRAKLIAAALEFRAANDLKL